MVSVVFSLIFRKLFLHFYIHVQHYYPVKELELSRCLLQRNISYMYTYFLKYLFIVLQSWHVTHIVRSIVN